MDISPIVTEAPADSPFSWLEKLGVKGTFDGHHRFQIEPLTDGSVRFAQSERTIARDAARPQDLLSIS